MAARKRSKNSVTRESLKQIALSHSQTEKALNEMAGKPETTKIVIEMFDNKLRELEVQVMHDLKSWLGFEVQDGA